MASNNFDADKASNIQSWMAHTAEETRKKKPTNVITPRHLSTYFGATGPPSKGSDRRPSEPGNGLVVSNDREASGPGRRRGRGRPSGRGRGRGRGRSQDAPDSDRHHFARRARQPRRKRDEQGWDQDPGPPAPPAGLLIDLRTPSEMERDAARAQQAQPEPTSSGSRLLRHDTRNSTGSALQQHSPSPQPSASHTRRRRGNMADTVEPSQYVPPHLRSRSQYVPPHLRKTAVRTTEPQLSQQPSQAAQSPQLQGAHADRGMQPSDAFQATRSKWAHPEPAEPDTHDGRAAMPSHGHYPSPPPTDRPDPAAGVPTLTDEHAWRNEMNDGQADAQAQNPPPSAPRMRSNGRNSHNPYNVNLGKPKRNNKWATNKEIRERAKKPPGEKSINWNSNGSENGFNSNPDADPQHDIRKLVDWEGNWLPGPTDWEMRRSYRHQNFNEEMMRFVKDSVDMDAAVDITKEPTFLDEHGGEVATRVWTSIKVENNSLQQWWQNRVLGDLDEPDSKAWWKTYTSQSSNLLAHIEVPEAKVDPSDENHAAYLDDLGCGHACDMLLEKTATKKVAREKRRKAEREAAAAAAASIAANYRPPETLKPNISLYIRPAMPADAHQIASIYNYYVRNTIHSAEMTALTAQAMANRIADETSNAMPWLVACAKGKCKGRGFQTGTDQILGFAAASDYQSRQSMYGYTGEAEVFVHPEYARRKVASCLLDRLLYILDPHYDALGGYQCLGNGTFMEHGGGRVIGSVVMNVPYDAADRTQIGWTTKWLNKFGITKAADLPEMGVKLGKTVNLAIFRYRTGSTIDPRSALTF